MSHTIATSGQFPYLMLSCALRSPRFLQKAGGRIRLSDFDDNFEKNIKIGMSIALEHWQGYRETPSKDMFFMKLESRLKDDPFALTENEKMSLVHAVLNAYATEEKDLHPDYVSDQLEKFIYDRRIRPLGDSLKGASPEMIPEIISRMQSERSGAVGSTGKVVRLFEPGREKFNSFPRVSTGIDFMDALIGGYMPGEVMGLLGPFGKGKTTLAVQLVCEFARNRNYSAYISYETDIVPGVSNRFYGYVGGLNRRDIANIQSLDPKRREAMHYNFREWADEYIVTIDMRQGGPNAGSGGPDELRATIQEQREVGKPLKLVVIDQYLSMVNRYMSTHSIPADHMRNILQNWVERIKDVASDEQCTIVLLHQTGTAKVNASPTKKPEAADSAEARSFPFWMDACIALGTQDHQNLQWLTVIKGREIPISSLILTMDGDNYRYRYDPDQDRYRISGSKFIDMKATDTSRVIDRSHDASSAPDTNNYNSADNDAYRGSEAAY